jgi:gliding motility-associated lipoprotein GldD
LKTIKLFYFIAFFFTVLTLACNQPYTIKKKGYPSLTFPDKSYQLFNKPGYPYQFEYPTYATIDNNVNYFGVSKKGDAWININFPNQGATLYVSYRPIVNNQLDTLVDDAYRFVNNHNNMANSIEDSVFTSPLGVHGVFFHIGGDVATAYQFYVTDSSKHFFRGALYFDTTPNEDSLAPINAFLFKDLKHLVNTFRWK